MLVFDSFPNRKSADDFVSAVMEDRGLQGCVFDRWEDAQEADPIPAVLVPPVVHVERIYGGSDKPTIELAKEFGGVFVGS